MIALTACDERIGGKGTEGINIEVKPYGVDGVIYENEPLNIEVEAKNKGYYDIPYGKVLLRGFDREILPFRNIVSRQNMAKKNLPDLPRRTEYRPEGGFATVEFEIPENHIKLFNDETYNPSLTFTACYFYQTEAGPSVCIVPRPGELTDESPCQPETINLQSQGAPVAVTKVEQEIDEGFARFIATVENLGGGQLISPETRAYDNCPTNLGYEDLDKVEVEMSLPGAPPPECSGDGIVRLEDGKGKVSCEFQITPASFDAYTGRADATPFTQQLTVNVDYHYKESVQHQIKVASRDRMGEISEPKDRPELIEDDEDEEEEKRVTDAMLSPCNCEEYEDFEEPDDPCVCLYYKGQEVFCYREAEPDLTLSEENPEFRVYGSHDYVDTCEISQHGSTYCGGLVEYDEGFDEGEEKTLTVIGYDDGEQVASQKCKIKREEEE